MGPGLAIIGAVAALSGGAPAHCPAGVPVQVITVVNQAHVSRIALAKVENALTDQSMQLRAAWGTPCVTWGAGGWKIYLKVGASVQGEHFDYGQPYALVHTDGTGSDGFSPLLSHEIVEMLVDPSAGRAVWLDGVSHPVEVADPVQRRSYRLAGVSVSDFALPAWFAGATTDGYTCVGPACTFPGPVLSPADGPGPWDHMGVLTGAWQTAPSQF